MCRARGSVDKSGGHMGGLRLDEAWVETPGKGDGRQLDAAGSWARGDPFLRGTLQGCGRYA